MDNRLIFLYPLFCLSNGGTQEAKECRRSEMSVQAVSLKRSQMLLFLRTSCDGEEIIVPKFLMSHCREKLLVRNSGPYRKPTQVVEENPKVSERTLVKELGKMTPNFGRRVLIIRSAAVNRPKRLFIKNRSLQNRKMKYRG